MSGALEGVLVADFTRVLAGPYATMLMADAGATVVKVERPGAGRRHPGVGSTLRPRRSVHLLPVGQPQQEVHRLGPHRLRRSGTRPPPSHRRPTYSSRTTSRADCGVSG